MEHNERLGVLVSTIDDRIDRVVRRLLPQLTRTHVLISHQVTDSSIEIHPDSFTGATVEYTRVDTRGLSKNRNNAIAHAVEEINLFADDDTEYVPDFERTILDEYAAHPDADIITFVVERGQNQVEAKTSHFDHTLKSIYLVDAIGVTFKKNALQKSGVQFDERFGKGAKYEGGETCVFLKDCMDAGLKVVHVHIPIVRHTHLSSAWAWKKPQVRARIAMHWRVYGPLLALFLPVALACARYSYYRDAMNPLGVLGTAYKTYFSILKNGL